MLFGNFNLYETPIVEVKNALFIKSPLIVWLLFSLSNTSRTAVKFLITLSSENDFFHKLKPMLQSLSFFI